MLFPPKQCGQRRKRSAGKGGGSSSPGEQVSRQLGLSKQVCAENGQAHNHMCVQPLKYSCCGQMQLARQAAHHLRSLGRPLSVDHAMRSRVARRSLAPRILHSAMAFVPLMQDET